MVALRIPVDRTPSISGPNPDSLQTPSPAREVEELDPDSLHLGLPFVVRHDPDNLGFRVDQQQALAPPSGFSTSQREGTWGRGPV